MTFCIIWVWLCKMQHKRTRNTGLSSPHSRNIHSQGTWRLCLQLFRIFCPCVLVYDVTDWWTDILALREKLLIVCNMHCWSVTNNWSVQISHLAQKSTYSSKIIYVVWSQMLPSEQSAGNRTHEHWHLHQPPFATVNQFTCAVELSTFIYPAWAGSPAVQ